MENATEDCGKFIYDYFGKSLKSRTKEMYNMIEVYKINEEYVDLYTSFFEKNRIPYKVRNAGENAYLGNISKLKESQTLYFMQMQQSVLSDEFIVQKGEKGICYLKQYEKDDTERECILNDLFFAFHSKNSEVEKFRFSSTVGSINDFLFDEIKYSDDYCYFVADKSLKDRFKRISSKILGYEISLYHIDTVSETLGVDGLVWFQFQNFKSNKVNAYMSYELLRALLEGEIRHVIIHDKDGKITTEIQIPRDHQDDNRISRNMYRDDLEIKLKSSWEANIARIFNFLGIEWRYEMETFAMGRESRYTPDFFLPNNIVVEVKGFWDNESRKKVMVLIKE